jgi:hypothetical protein
VKKRLVVVAGSQMVRPFHKRVFRFGEGSEGPVGSEVDGLVWEVTSTMDRLMGNLRKSMCSADHLLRYLCGSEGCG